MTNFTPFLMIAAYRQRLLTELSAAGLHVTGAPPVAAPKPALAPATTPSGATTRPVVTVWPDTRPSSLSTTRTKLEAT
ncbi:MAG: hypothetical protein IPG83_18020 [Novosphingobium sp.]|nr:hypothetical protein [Novosphingobium sp.]